MAKQTLENNILMRLIKILDFLFIIPFYFISAIMCGYIINYIYNKYDVIKYEDKSIIRLEMEVIIELWLMLIVAYIIRNIVELIPFPLDNYKGFIHKNVREVRDGNIFVTLIFIFNPHIQTKIHYIFNYYI